MTLLLLAALLGCTVPVGNDGGSDNSSNDDTTTTEPGKATLTFAVTVLGSATPTSITLECDADASFTTSSGQRESEDAPANTPFTVETGTSVFVDAPAWCSAEAGLTDYEDLFGYPVIEQGGMLWAASASEADLESGGSNTMLFDAFQVFEPGVYACSYDKYALDDTAADLKGALLRSVDVDPQIIAVLQDGIVEPEDNPSMDVVGRNDDHLQVVGDALVLEASGDSPSYIAESALGIDTFSLTVVDPVMAYVADVVCVLDE